MATCSVPDCKTPARRKDLCGSHYQRFLKHGDPLGGGSYRFVRAKYLSEVSAIYGGADCLIWPYYRNKAGYGVTRHDGKSALASRVLCEMINGSPPSPTHQAAHTCGNGHLGCVTPHHLEWKTPLENSADKTVHANGSRTKLTRQQAAEIKAARGMGGHRALAERFNISPATVASIQAGRTWKTLETAKAAWLNEMEDARDGTRS